MSHRFIGCAFIISSVLGSGCTTPTAGDDEPLGVRTDAFKAETATTKLIHRAYAGEPDVTLRSYAVFTQGDDSCTGTMVGPNVAMTAQHCFPNPATLPASKIVFRTFREDGQRFGEESFVCESVLSAWGIDGDRLPYDLTLLHCPPNAAGENPGDKYGYLDFDTSDPVVGEKLYSVWRNTLEEPTYRPDVRLWSTGSVHSTSWRPDYPSAVLAMEGVPGASGSAHVVPVTGRIKIGPLSLAGDGFRYAFSMKDYFEKAQSVGRIENGQFVPRQNSVYLVKKLPEFFANEPNPAVQHNLARYTGTLDRWSGTTQTPNKVFDVQEDLERHDGEGPRAWYAFDFGSERQNAVWKRASSATFVPAAGLVRIQRAGTGPITALTHDRIRLPVGGRVRVSAEVRTRSTSSSAALRISAVGFGGATASGAVATVADGNWRKVTFTLTTPAWSELRIESLGAFDGDLANLVIADAEAPLGFDNHDERRLWTNANDGKRAKIVPEGRNAATRVDWAASVESDRSRTPAQDWALRSWSLGILGGVSQRLCFDVKARPSSGAATGQVKINSGSATPLSQSFAITTSWRRVCTSPFTPPTGDNVLLFGVADTDRTVSRGYFVDNVAFVAGNAGAAIAPGISIVSATFGGDRTAAAIDNATVDAARTCDGQRSCAYRVDPAKIGDPAVGLIKSFHAKYRCDGSALVRTVEIPRDANGAVATFDCTRDGIEVVEATYGHALLGVAPGVQAGNATTDIGRACNGQTACLYTVDHRVLGDPAPGKGKNLRVDFRCSGGALRTVTLSAEAGLGSMLSLACP
jgi:hypothetical protein